MKELEKEIIKDLLVVYNEYVEKGLTDSLKEKAKLIQSKYLFSSPLIDKVLFQAIGKLTYFYADIKPGPISKKEAKELVDSLKKIEKKLKKS